MTLAPLPEQSSYPTPAFTDLERVTMKMRKRQIYSTLLIMTILILSLNAKDSAQSAEEKTTKIEIESQAVALVKEQLVAYNKRDIDGFLEPYSEEVKIYKYPNTFRYEGKKKMRDRYGKYFQSYSEIDCVIVSRTVLGNVVIDHERVTRTMGKQTSVSEAIAIYTIENGKISEVRFISY